MNSFNGFHKGTCILLDSLFLKHTKTKKKEKKCWEGGEQKPEISWTSFDYPPSPAEKPVPFRPSSEQLTQLRISFLQDEVPF